MNSIIIYCSLLLFFINYATFLACAAHLPNESAIAEYDVEVEYDLYIKMECFTLMNYTEFTNLLYTSNIHQGIRNKTLTLKIFNCPLPDDGNSLTDMLDKLGIISYRKLLLKSHDKYLHLTKQHFSNIRELERLTLDLKSWDNLAENLFEDGSLKSLEILDLYTNASFIPRNIFNNLENLTSLKIGSNVESLGYEVFRKQTRLQTLNLAHNKLKHLHPSVFKTNVQLNNLYLENNYLENLPQGIFAYLQMLENLTINENKIQYLPENIFFNSSSIKTIVLNHNRLEFLPKNLLQHQQNLENLDLSYNNLKALPDGFLDNSKKIKIINLSHNALTTIESTAFANLPKLQLLDLSHNRLNSIDFTPELQTDYNLETINLKNNSISNLQIFHKHLPRHLKTLDLSFNQVECVIGKNFEFLYTDNLILNLTYNRIHTIKLNDFGSKNLVKILTVTVDFNQNPLKCDCDLWGMKMSYLNDNINAHLKFYSNNLKCAKPEGLKGRFFRDLNPSEILCPVQWKYADFQQCPTQCECRLRPYDTTLIIDCTRKNLTQLPDITNIRNYDFKAVEFNLSMNFINQLPTTRHAEADYFYKTELILYQNNLTSINKNQIPLNVAVLDLRRNHLTHLDEDTLSFMNSSQRLTQIKLTGNKWLCDCSQTSWALFMFTHRNMEKFKDASQMTCFNYDTPLKYVHEIPALCYSNDLLYTLIGLCVVLIVLTLAWKYQIVIKYWFYDHNLCPLWLTPIPDEYSEEYKYDAFISYSHKDEKFIVNYLVPELENVAPKFKLCIHTRDFLVGDYIPDQIIRCIAESRRVIVVLSKNFLQSEWSKLEFKEACRSTLEQRKMKIIVIIYEDLGDINGYDKEFQIYLKMNTYLKWGDPQFWKKLRRAMPHKLK